MLTATLVTSVGGSDPGMPWLVPVITILSAIIGSQGVSALLRLRHDKRLGIAQQDVAEEDAEAKRWQAIIETQTRVLLDPMVVKIKSLEDEQSRLHTELGTVRRDLETSRRKYWAAVAHIRNLYTWIARHLPEDIEQTQIPAPPATLAEDI